MGERLRRHFVVCELASRSGGAALGPSARSAGNSCTGAKLALGVVFSVARRTTSKTHHVAVIADNPQTLANLDAYFERVGVTSSGSRALNDHGAVPRAATALVLFPDDYPRSEVETFVVALRRTRPKLFVVLVTSAPRDFGSATEPDGRTMPPLVLPRPAFGWTILDAIRSAGSLAGSGNS